MSISETKNDRVTATVEKLVYGGDALSRVNGQVMLAPFALPGEQIEVETAPGKGKVLRGFRTRVLTASPHRVQPGCEYFGRCGGCQYQHADYAYQVEQKASILRETLARLGSVSFDAEIGIVSAEPWQYRNRVQLHFEGNSLGFRRAESHKLCAITHCPISSPKLNEVIRVFSDAMKRPEWPRFLRGLEIFTNEADVQLHVTDTTRPLAGRFFSWCAEMIDGIVDDALEYEADGRRLRVSRGTFFQVNRFLIEALIKEVTAQYQGETVIDLYAGAGLFSLPFSKRFENVIAVERGSSAYRDLEFNARSEPKRLSTEQATTEEFLSRLVTTPDLLVADPPRAGLGPEVTAELLRIQAAKLVIVSCDPSTLARDLKVLTAMYDIRRITLIDLFPQTFHFETLVHLELKR
jgi:23S rRNA (uracil1939-C5)-methyltransferase